VPTAYLTEKTSILLPARVVQTGNSFYVNDIEQDAIIAMSICLLNQFY